MKNKKAYLLVLLIVGLFIIGQRAQATEIVSDLTIGASGVQVTSLQDHLEQKGFLTMPFGIAKGYFGLLTKNAVIKYQASLGLPATGYVGPMTRGKINTTVVAAKPDLLPQVVIPSITKKDTPVSTSGTKATIKVISPNDGETFKQGQSVDVKWFAQNYPAGSTVSINLTNENGVYEQFATGLNPGLQSYKVTMNAYPGKNIKISLDMYVPVPVTPESEKGMIVVNDSSDKNFTLTLPSGDMPEAPVIKSLSRTSFPNDAKTTVTLKGSGFTESTAIYFSNSQYKQAYKTAVKLISDQAVEFVIAQNFPPAGEYELLASNDGITMSNPLDVTIKADPDYVPPTPVQLPVISTTGPTITGIIGPTAMIISSAGMWTINISNPNPNSVEVTIDWGDDSSTEKKSISQSGSVQFGRQYTQSGKYTITITAKDSKNGSKDTKTAKVEVW